MYALVSVNTSLIQDLIQSSGFRTFLDQYNIVISAALSIVTLSVIVLFFMNVVKFSHNSNNDWKRKESMTGILVCLICLGCIGGIDILYGIVLGLIFGM